MNNKRKRLASACSCLSLKPAATGDVATAPTIYLSAIVTGAASSSVIDGQSPTSTLDVAAATTTSSEDEGMDRK